MDKLKGVTPKAEAITAPVYAANAKQIGSEPIVQNVGPETSAFQKGETQGCDCYEGMVSSLKVKK